MKVTVAVVAFIACTWYIPAGAALAESASSSSTVRVTVLDSIAIGGNAREIYGAHRQHSPQYQTRIVTRAASSILGRIEAADDGPGFPSGPGGNEDGFDGVPWSGIILVITATHL